MKARFVVNTNERYVGCRRDETNSALFVMIVPCVGIMFDLTSDVPKLQDQPTLSGDTSNVAECGFTVNDAKQLATKRDDILRARDTDVVRDFEHIIKLMISDGEKEVVRRLYTQAGVDKAKQWCSQREFKCRFSSYPSCDYVFITISGW